MGARPRVLVVDDDPLALGLIMKYLSPSDYELVFASDGEQAWTMLDGGDDPVDIVLTDRIMPRMSGLELLARIKGDPRLSWLPVIIATSAADKREIIEGINAGAFYYLTKPLDDEVLRSMVRAALSDSERYRELQREVQAETGVMVALMRRARFEFRTPEEASDLGAFIARACPDPQRVVMGLSELLVNAVEHGNLEIGYEQKSELHRRHRWRDEIERRLQSDEFADRVATVVFERSQSEISITIRDQGPGFDPAPYMRIDPGRVFDSHGRGIAIANLLSFENLEYRDGGREVVGRLSDPPTDPE